ncbi:MAG: FRG domain-containing protein [Verrucomicrobiota bacterium]|jgi:hypothetical protein
MAVITIDSLNAFTKLVQARRKKSAGPLWYRGCGDFKRHELRPSLYRHPKFTASSQLADLEARLLVRFRQRANPFEPPPLPGEWEPLFFMQHYDIPTRLLDWSENPFMAFYFAVMAAKQNDQKKFTSDAAVWILDPVTWNRHALKDTNFKREVLSVADDELKGYVHRKDYEGMKEFPVALYGTHNSGRIVAQRGVFMIFGQSTVPMETAYEDGQFPKDCLVKIKFPKRKLAQLKRAIIEVGITDSVVFPDFVGLAKELKRYFDFEV